MGLSAKQVQALRRNLDHRYVRTRESNGRALAFIQVGDTSPPPSGLSRFSRSVL